MGKVWPIRIIYDWQLSSSLLNVTRFCSVSEDSMVQVKPFVRRAGPNSVLYLYIDQAERAMRRAKITSAAVLERPFAR